MEEERDEEAKVGYDIESKTINAYQKQKRKQKITNRISKKEFNLKFKEYFKSRLVRDYLNIILASFIAMVAYDYFIGATTSNGIMPTGISAISRGITVAIWPTNLTLQNSMYWIVYLIFNVPLFIYAVIKVSPRFAIRSIVFIILQNAFHFAIAYIPIINPTSFTFIIPFDELKLGYKDGIWLFIFAIVSALMNGTSYGLLYKSSASSGGTDFIFAHLSTKSKKSIAKYNKTLNFFIVLFMVALRTIMIKQSDISNIFPADGTGGETYIHSASYYKLRYYFGPVLFASFLFVVLQAFTTDIIFPKYKYRSITVITTKSNAILSGLNFIKYNTEITRMSAITNSAINLTQSPINAELLIIPTSLVDYKSVKAAIVISDPDAKIIALKAEQLVNYFI